MKSIDFDLGDLCEFLDCDVLSFFKHLRFEVLVSYCLFTFVSCVMNIVSLVLFMALDWPRL